MNLNQDIEFYQFFEIFREITSFCALLILPVTKYGLSSEHVPLLLSALPIFIYFLAYFANNSLTVDLFYTFVKEINTVAT